MAQCSLFPTYCCNCWILCISGFESDIQVQRHFKSFQNDLFLFLKNGVASQFPSILQPRSPLSWLDVCVKVDTETVFTTGGYHMSRAKPGGMISAFV